MTDLAAGFAEALVRSTWHHPELYRAGRFGCWSACHCGWRSRWSYTTVTGAHLAFGEHLLAVTRG